jgi:hypothetical protein
MQNVRILLRVITEAHGNRVKQLKRDVVFNIVKIKKLQ